MTLLALGWTQLGSAYHLSCDDLDGHLASHVRTATDLPSHHHGSTAADVEQNGPEDAAPRPDCPLLMQGQGCAATAIPGTMAEALEAGPATARPLWSVTEAIDLLLTNSLLRPPQA